MTNIHGTGWVVAIVGPQRSGKEAQCKRLARATGAVHFSSGSSDEMERLPAAIESVPSGQPIVLEGVTRKPGEQDWLDELLEGLRPPRKLARVILLEIDHDTFMLRNRRGRPDDMESLRETWWHAYLAETRPAIEYYSARGILTKVPGEGTREEVRILIGAALRDIAPNI